MRSIKWLIIVVGVSALALVFLGRVAAGSSFSAKDFGRSTGTTYAFRMGPVKSFSSDNSNQTSGVGGSGLATAPRQDILRVGVFTATAGLDSCTTTGIPPVTTCTPSNNGTLTGRTIATTEIYTLSLHDALPISRRLRFFLLLLDRQLCHLVPAQPTLRVRRATRS